MNFSLSLGYRYRTACFLLPIWGLTVGIAFADPRTIIEPCGPVPSERQSEWHALEFYGFVHFSINTFTDKEWGYGNETPDTFRPTELDCRQWARVAREAGMKGLILTAKHHDGFCLWPSKYTEHSVKNSPWKNGRGDVVRELSDACREHGLRFGVYLSPWDRNHAQYGRAEYVDYYHQQLKELLKNYGEIFEVWLDGANGGTGYYGGADQRRDIDRETYYRFPEIYAITRQLQPRAVIFSDAGPDVRWIGNEKGFAPESCWGKINPVGMIPGAADRFHLARGDSDGTVWRPAEVDVSIRKGWFYHPAEQPKSLYDLLDIYYHSVGRGCCLNLNITPDRRGKLPEEDVERLIELGKAIKATFRTDLALGKSVTASSEHSQEVSASRLTDGDRMTFWAAKQDANTAHIVVDFGNTTSFNRVRLQEHILLGQLACPQNLYHRL